MHNHFSLQVEGSIDVTINTEDHVEEAQKAKEEPAWLSQTSSFITTHIATADPDDSEVREFLNIAHHQLMAGGGGI